MDIKNCKAYELIEKREVSDINSVAYLIMHKKTKAKVLVLENDDDNKVFSIGFRTPPYDSTGLPHIMEHSVLCGSKKYPSKDPFVELAKGSLNTFLNAMTFPDKTVYPIASCNDKDFRNLCNVYLDAVFYPNIYEREEIFMQEGWHYELENAEDELTINGVVYNEMKGAFSSPDDQLDRRIFESLYPDNCYGLESGGDPDVIPELTYEKFLQFHRDYYHPSNSYIYLYGNADMEDTLNFIDNDYLSDFDYREIDSAIAKQSAFESVREMTFDYSITEGESLEDNTYLSYNAVIDTSLNRELYVAFQIIEYALLEASGAVLKEALIKNGVGKDILSTYENGIYQPFFSIIAKNANEEDKDKFIQIIREVLDDVVEKGFDKKTLMAGINSYEFRYREADFGHYPKGLIYGLQSFDSWLYDGDPIMHIAENDTFAMLKEKVDSNYFEKLVKDYLIDNSHASVVVVKPVTSLTAKGDAALAKKLGELKASLSKDEIEDFIKKTKHLKEYQEKEDSEEVLKTLPLLSIEDLDKKPQGYVNNILQQSNPSILKHDIFTNGIAYIRLLFDLSKVETEDLHYVALLKELLGLLDTENYSYADLASEINLNSGGINPGSSVFVNAHNTAEYTHCFEMKASVLYDKLGFAFEMFKEILFKTDFSDEMRLKELINMMKSRMQAALMSSGHSFASLRAMSEVSEIGALSEYMGGITYYRFIENLANDFDNQVTQLKVKLKDCLNAITTKENFIMADLTAEEQVSEEFIGAVNDFSKELFDIKKTSFKRSFNMNNTNEGFKTSGKVQYVAKGGNFKDELHPYVGSLRILKTILGYDYLWNNVRVMGGAYGCFSSFSKSGDAFFASYRDPNLKKTLDIYDKAASYFANFTADDRTMTKYIIGTIADLDSPLNPSARGARSLSGYMTNLTIDMLEKERQEILTATDEDIRKLAGYLENIMSRGNICVLGGEEIIKNEESLFDKTQALFS